MPFPANTQFIPILVNAQPVFDLVNDESPVSTDLVGNTTYPAGYFAYDGTNIYFRIRLNGDPRNSTLTAFRNFAWGVLLNTSGEAGTYDWLFNVDGNNNRVALIRNTTKLVNSWNDPAEGTGGGSPNYSRTIASFDIARAIVADSTFGGNADYFLDWSLPASILFSTLGINENSSLSTIFFTSANSNNYNKDSLRANEGFSFASALSNPTTPAQADVRAKLSIEKRITSGPSIIQTGQQANWAETVTVINTGRSQATSVTVQDVLGLDTISFLNGTSVSQGTTAYNQTTKTLSWNLGNIAAGATATLNYSLGGLFTQAGTRTFNIAMVNGFDSFTGSALPARSDTETISVIASGSLTGSVINGSSGLPVPGSTVSLYQGATLVSTTSSNTNGVYSFTGQSHGTYTLQAAKIGYYPYSASAAITSGATATQNILLSPQTATINGTITNTGGSPLNEAQINIINSSGVTVQQTTSNASGQYTFTNVPSGTYTISVNIPNYQSEAVGIQPGANEAMTVNFTLQPSTGNVTGTIVGPGSVPINGAIVEVVNQGGVVVATTTTNESGTFSIPGLAPGFYTVRSSALGYGANQTGVNVVSAQSTTTTVALSPNPGRVSGTVTDEDSGMPLSGVSISFINSNGTVVASTTTDDSGSYLSPSLQPDSYTLIFLKGGYGSETTGALIDSGQTTTYSTSLSKLAGALSGTVTDPYGNPISSTTVTLAKNNIQIATATTDAAGNYFIGGISPGVYTVYANAASFGSTSTGAVIQSEEISITNFVMIPNPGSLTGIVSDLSDNSIQGASVAVRQGTGSGPVVANIVTDENGFYVITGLSPGNYTINVNAIGYENSANGVVILADTQSTANFSLFENPGTLTGTITNGVTGLPIASANVEVRILDGNGITVANVYSDINGQFQTPSLAPETYTILVFAEGFQVNGATVAVPPGGTVFANVSLLPNPGRIEGAILDGISRQPLAGAAINLLDPSGALVQTGVTDSQGFFQLNNLAPGTYTLAVLAAGYQSANTGVDVQSNGTAVVALSLAPSPGAIYGVIAPIIPNTIVQLYTSSNVFIGSTLPSATGDFLFSNLASGSYILSAFAPDYTTEVTGASVVSNTTTSTAITLQPNPATITGTIVNESGQPVINATIVVSDQNETILGTGFADANGHYSIGNLPPKDVTLSVFAPNYGRTSTGAVLGPGEQATVNITLHSDPGSISGSVNDSVTGAPLPEVVLMIRQQSSGGLAGTYVTDQNGNFLINDLTPGSYTIAASTEQYGSNQIGAIVITNQTTSATLSLSPLYGSISGTVTDEDGAAITGDEVQVKVFANNVVVATTVANSVDSSFVFKNLSPGNYIVVANAATYSTQTVSAQVEAGVTSSISIPLPLLPGTIQGSVEDAITGAGIDGVFVTIRNSNNQILSTVLTDQSGQFIVHNVPAVSIIVTAEAHDFGLDSVAVYLAPGQTQTILLKLSPDPGNISGFVSNNLSAEPISGIAISLRDATAATVATVMTNSFGQFSFNGVNQGNYTLIASKNGFSTSLTGITVVPNATSTASISLEPNPGFIQGTVIDAIFGSPIANAEVFVRSGSPSGPITLTATTNSSGFYATDGLLPGTYTVIVSSLNYGSGSQSAFVQSNEATFSNFTLQQLPAAVQGFVTDETTSLPLNALLRLSDENGTIIQSTQTNESGYFLINGFTAGTYSLVAIRTGFETETVSFSVAPNETAAIDFSLTLSAAALVGQVLDEETTNPLSGAIVEVYRTGSSTLAQRAITDNSGQYAVPGLPAGNYRTMAILENYQTRTDDVSLLPAQTTSFSIKLLRNPAAVTGLIYDSLNGFPLAGASVQMVKSGTEIIISNTLTDQDGTYMLENLPQGTYTMVAGTTGYSAAITGVTLTPGGFETIDIALAPNPAAVSGTIRNSVNGASIQGALVQAYDGLSSSLLANTFTDASGVYTFAGLPPAFISIVASAEGFGTHTSQTNLAPGETITIELSISPKPGTLSGIITSSLDGSPISNANISLFLSGTSTFVVSRNTETSGVFSIPGLAQGLYDIVISQPDFGTTILSAAVTSDQETILNTTLIPSPGSIFGTVKGQFSGTALEGAVVNVFIAGTSTPVQTAVVDKYGEFLITGLTPGTYAATFTNPGYQSSAVPITLSPGQQETINALLASNPGRITGVISDFTTGWPIPGVQISLYIDGTDLAVSSTATDELGQYSLSSLPDGIFVLNVTKALYTARNVPVTLSPGEAAEISLSLQPNPSIVTGRVVQYPDGQPLHSAVVQAFQGSTLLSNSFSDSEGYYVLSNLPSGNVDLVVSYPDYVSLNQTVFLPIGVTKTANFPLRPSPATLEGKVVNGVSGESLEHAIVQVYDSSGTMISSTITDAAGFYTITGLPPAQLGVTISSPGLVTQTSLVSPLPNQTLVLNANLEENPAAIFGLVTNRNNGLPIENALVEAFIGGAAVPITSTITDANGYYLLENLPPRVLRILFSAPLYMSDFVRPVLSPGETRVINQGLQTNPATLRGTVSSAADGLPIFNATTQITIAQTGILFGTTTTDEFGQYEFNNLQDGFYNAIFSADGFIRESISFTIEPNEVLVINALLQSNPGMISGRVTDTLFGAPLAPAVIQVFDELSLELLANGLTEPDGTYSISSLPTGRFRVGASMPSFQREVKTISVGVGESAILDFQLDFDPARFSGTVTSAVDSQPIDSALVKVFLGGTDLLLVSTFTDSNGFYEFITLPNGVILVEISAHSYITQISERSLLSGDDEVLNAVLLPLPSTIYGTVSDSSTGLPLGGALVQVALQGSSVVIANTITDSVGDYFIRGLPAGTYDVIFSSAGYSLQAESITIGSNESLQVYASLLTRPASVTGTIKDIETGEGLIGAIVQVYNRTGGFLVSTISDANGEYTIPNLSPGEVSITFSKPNYASDTLSVMLAAAAIEVVNALLSPNPASLNGMVSDQVTGLPIESALVQVFIAGSTVSIASFLTDQNGLYSITGLPGRVLRAIVSKAGFESAVERVVLSAHDSKYLPIILAPSPGNITGTVSSAATAQPIANALVQLILAQTGIIFAFTTTTSSGNYNLAGIPAGTYNLLFSAETYANESVAITVSPGESLVITASLLANLGTIFGSVQTSDGGKPLSGALIQFFDELSLLLYGSALTLEDGTYSFSGLPDGRYRVVASNSGYQREIMTVDLAQGAFEQADFALPENPAILSGTVSNNQTLQAIHGALVKVYLAGTDVLVVSGLTEPDGTFKFISLPQGALLIETTADKYATDVQRIDAIPGESVVLDILLDPHPAEVRGTVTESSISTDGKSTPLAGVLVHLVIKDSETIVATSLTELDGIYRMESLPPGTYKLIFSLDMYGSEIVDVTLAPSESRTIDVELVKNDSVLFGTVSEAETEAVLPDTIVQVFLIGAVDSDSTNQSLFAAGYAAPNVEPLATLIASTLTDINGYYEFSTLPINTVLSVVFSRVGFIPQSFEVTIPPNSRLEQIAVLVNIPSHPCLLGDVVEINGIFVDAQGIPLSGVGTEIQNATIQAQQIARQTDYILTVSGFVVLEVITTLGICETPPLPFSKKFVYTVTSDAMTSVKFDHIGDLACEAKILCARNGEFIAADVLISFTAALTFTSHVNINSLPETLCMKEPLTVVEYLQLVKSIQDAAQKGLRRGRSVRQQEVILRLTEQEEIHMLLTPPDITFVCRIV